MPELVKLGSWRDWWWLGREAVFNLNITSPRRHIQQVADITYPAENVESKKEAPSQNGKMVLLSQLALFSQRF